MNAYVHIPVTHTHTHTHPDGSKSGWSSRGTPWESPIFGLGIRRDLPSTFSDCQTLYAGWSRGISSVFVGLIATYFTFNMAYPKAVYPVLLFVQHFLLCINNKQAVSISLTSILSSLDKMKKIIKLCTLAIISDYVYASLISWVLLYVSFWRIPIHYLCNPFMISPAVLWGPIQLWDCSLCTVKVPMSALEHPWSSTLRVLIWSMHISTQKGAI